jgi:serine/threonine-protein kinase
MQKTPAPLKASPPVGPSTPQPKPQLQPSARAPVASGSAPKPKPQIAKTPKPVKQPEDVFIGTTLNGRFRIDSKIGEGGFGSVYRGIQLATGRKVALKLLHPEMTNDDNLVARFRREGLVLCNLRDAHTITTYDFDQTPEGTLYIAMELLEGRSLHQIFHDEAPIEWRRMFKILGEMCSSLAEAHAQGIVHRDLKPENIYLENRPGNPEFVKILDFGIAKVMRGEGSMDPQAPQLTATGQTLGTLEYMSPEQLMGKQLDGRSDVYALGVLAYELITGQLPFPDAKGPAGLITAQLKQTPKLPSAVRPEVPSHVDKVLLKCLEKDKNNRYADVTQLSGAVHDAMVASGTQKAAPRPPMKPEVIETQRGEPSNLPPPPAMPPNLSASTPAANYGGGSSGAARQPMVSSGVQPPMHQPQPQPQPQPPHPHHGSGGNGPTGGPVDFRATPMPSSLQVSQQQQAGMSQGWHPGGSYPTHQVGAAPASRWLWLALGLLTLGAVTGAVLAYVL